MTGIDIMDLIDDLEAVINESKGTLMGGDQKKIIETDALYDIIDEIRANYPDELRSARRTLKERDEMLQAAEVEANRIINDAKEQALIIAGDQEVVRLAQQRADEIMEQAREMERETRYGAEDYADQVFAYLEENVNKVASSLARSRERLNQTAEQYNKQNW